MSSQPRSGIKDLDLLKLRHYCQEYRKIEYDDGELSVLCYNMELIDEQQRLTVLENLFFAKKPARLLPQAGLELNAFDGVDVTANINDSITLLDTLPACIQEGEAFVRRNSHIRPVMKMKCAAAIFMSMSRLLFEKCLPMPFLIGIGLFSDSESG